MPTRVSAPTDVFPKTMDAIPASMQVGYYEHGARYLLDGKVHSWDGPCQEVFSPVCLHGPEGPAPYRLGHYPLMTSERALEALAAAQRAYDHGRGPWPTMSVADRIRHLQAFIPRMEAVRDEVVRLLMWEIGKTLPDARKEFDRTVVYIRDTIQALKELDRISSRFALEQGFIAQIRRSPLGVVLCMGPFNYPLNETYTTLIPALIMGNTVIFKPPKIGVLLHRPLLRAFRDAFPAGVVNTIYGDGAKVVGPLMESGKIDVLAFIGSSRVADIIKKQHPKPHRLRSVLGLEAKNAGIVLRDADIDPTVKECVTGALSFKGQRCTALKILFVHKDIVVEFLKKLNQRIASLAPGMPWDDGVGLTPLPEPDKTEHMKRYIEDAKEQGAMVVNEKGGAINRTFMFPAVLYPVNNRMRIYHEEQFGPVIPVVPYDRIEEPLDYVVNSNYGQQVAVFGNDPDAIARLVDPLVNQVCRVNINSQCQRGPDTFPFTGRKDSAEGTLSVTDALRVFTIRTLVAAKETDQNKRIITDIIREKKSNFLSTDFIF